MHVMNTIDRKLASVAVGKVRKNGVLRTKVATDMLGEYFVSLLNGLKA